ncbi:MAG: hypothetical protein HYY20_00455, partial [Candidatus Tectomicrobia bacterium]|nr:hypothetical protein [Candidatus Tectomicrobia bacterium]
MDEKDPQALWEELLDRFKSGKINRRGLLKAASAAGMTAAALKLLSAWETGTFSGATAYAGPILNKKGAYTVDPVT